MVDGVTELEASKDAVSAGLDTGSGYGKEEEDGNVWVRDCLW